MDDAKWYLNNWQRWNREIEMLEDEQDSLRDMRKSPNLGDSVLGGKYRTEVQKMNDLVENIGRYQDAEKTLEFLSKRIESGIANLLSEEQREVCLIYAKYGNSKDRENEALLKGYTRATYFRLLNESVTILNDYLNIKAE